MHIVTGEEMNKIDRCTIEEVGIHGEMLMENAGRAVAKKLCEQLRPADRIAVIIGTGNNGGDGFVIARVLLEAGYDLDVWMIPPKEKIKGDARKHLQIFEASAFKASAYLENEDIFSDRIHRCTVIIDALLGTGISGVPLSPYKEVIEQVNASGASGATVVSVDVPSGVPASGGEITGEPVKADRTITLQCPKIGAVTYPSADYYGKWETVDIGIPRHVIDKTAAPRRMWCAEDVKRTLPNRGASSHKGSHGKGLLIAGSEAMTGASVMAARAAQRAGAGLLTVAVPNVIHAIVASQVTEATYALSPSKDGAFAGHLPLELASFDRVAVGPGMGRNEGAGHIIEGLLRECASPLVIDADGLYFLTRFPSLLQEREAPTVLTPHPGEMAHLLGISVKDVQNRRFEVSRQFARANGVYLVLKGPYTIVTTPGGEQFVNPTGNASLAKGGTGDILTGLILAFIMQHSDLQAAVSNAVYLHGQAADFLVAQDHSPIDVLATDVIAALPQTLRRFLSTEI